MTHPLASPAAMLQYIAACLDNTDPLDLIAAIAPQLPRDAVRWARHLSVWDEFQGQFPDQAIAIARVVSRRTMREFQLAFDNEGRVDEKSAQAAAPWKDEHVCSFPMQIGAETVEVRYTKSRPTAWISFVGQEMPAGNSLSTRKPHPLSDTGWWSHRAPSDAVEAVGGIKAYATRCAEARLAAREQEFTEQFEGKPPEEKPRRTKPRAAATILGQHTAAVVSEAERQDQESVQEGQPAPASQPVQRHLFE